ncbi:pentatricopeptide repeat-containing protein At3g49170, chloroplastic isoform X2 [Malania oleifera]|uniref:pentatricopeptide repeat-containing protein At3g49170, chloroplastic isoform X2 n=1 Tax=Malania oleifera TaxID=397392 RepID=UPI0025AE4C5C|nr:pentatricopeptide repeat-containing protein At3g49170, chloroplastic isoform X2 [Malania oleifera]
MMSFFLPSAAKLQPSLPPSKPSRHKLSQSPPLSLSPLHSPKHYPNSEALNNRLIHLADAGRLREAIAVLDQGFTPDLPTFSVLLKSCIRSGSFELGKLVHAQLTRSGLQFDSIALNTLISLYSKCGDWVAANGIFESMGERRNLVSWSAMISCFANNNLESQAIVAFFDMVESGWYPNEYCFSAVIRACSNVENLLIGRLILGFVIKTGYFESHVCVGCALIDMFVKGGSDLGSAYTVFDKMPERNVVTWTLMITRYAQLGQPIDAIDLYLNMVQNGFVPDRFTFSSVVPASAELGLLSLGQQLHSQVIRSGLALDSCVGCSLVDMYAKCASNGSVDESKKVFDQMTGHNVMSWTAIITGYVQNGEHDKEAIDLFCKMIKGPVQPNHFTFASVFKACGSLSDLDVGEQVHSLAVKLGLSSVNCVGNSIISMYARSDRMEDARKAFDVLFEKNLVSYNAVVDGYTKNMNSDEAFELFHQIEDRGFGVSAFTFASLLSGAASIGAISKGEQIHARLLKAGFESNQCICNALISMYSKCGNLLAASQVFDEMSDQNLISWTSIITGFAKHGYATRALEMFRKMIEIGVKPNEITYIAVLSACSHVGMIYEGWNHFNSMQKEHGIVPRMEHYACMVDLLGRSGLLAEAVDFINSMPFKADALVWRTLLGACAVHGNSELGKHAANMILEQDPHDPAAYILLSNLYASTGKWEDVVKIRKNMKERKLIKEAGYSWIEIESKVHKFYVGDTSHPSAREIYEELDQLAFKIKEVGYVPNTDFVLSSISVCRQAGYNVVS